MLVARCFAYCLLPVNELRARGVKCKLNCKPQLRSLGSKMILYRLGTPHILQSPLQNIFPWTFPDPSAFSVHPSIHKCLCTSMLWQLLMLLILPLLLQLLLVPPSLHLVKVFLQAIFHLLKWLSLSVVFLMDDIRGIITSPDSLFASSCHWLVFVSGVFTVLLLLPQCPTSDFLSIFCRYVYVHQGVPVSLVQQLELWQLLRVSPGWIGILSLP